MTPAAQFAAALCMALVLMGVVEWIETLFENTGD